MKIFLYLIVLLFLLGCDESHPKSHNFLAQSSHDQALIYPKEAIDSKQEAASEKQIFQNEQIINDHKIQKREPSSHSILSLWWIVAIALSLIIIVYYLKRLAKKNRQMLEILQEKFQNS